MTSSVHATTVAENAVSFASTPVTAEGSMVSGVVLVAVGAIGVYYIKRHGEKIPRICALDRPAWDFYYVVEVCVSRYDCLTSVDDRR
jgi:hypothetical protein